MTLRAYLHILLKRWRMVLLGTVVGLGAAGLFSYLATPVYAANATAFVRVAPSGWTRPAPSSAGA